ncbi:hypothetical protein C7450_101566 [Chelatococcus asaccharovorans]|uniref:Uncharacterized protein n=1 Tax=Chelatococcus asaccharovorans TaxID=28210 RepID=A0A2V3UIZ7_9HYPH|nr:hypothetical protein C7450_101566 [Chelatococcus asaccharovorans]
MAGLVSREHAYESSDPRHHCRFGSYDNITAFNSSVFLFLFDNRHALLVKMDVPRPEVILPLGISFIVFEAITYLVDVYRGVCPPVRAADRDALSRRLGFRRSPYGDLQAVHLFPVLKRRDA